MANVIKINPGAVSSKSLQNAIRELKEASNALNSTMGYMSPSDVVYCIPSEGYPRNLFSENMCSNANNAVRQLQEVQSELNRIANILSSGPQEFEEIDSGFKGTYTNAWQRTWHSVGGAFATVFSPLAFWNSLFHNDDSKTGDSTPIKTDDNIVNADDESRATSLYLFPKEFKGESYQCLKVSNDYPDQAPNECWANSVSIAESIMNNEGVSGIRQNAEYDCTLMANDISQGRPVLLHFLHESNGGEHWIVAVGVKSGSAEPHSLGDFLFVDSYDGQLCGWDKMESWYDNPRPCGIQRYA